MGNIDFVEEWLDFQSHDVFQASIDQVQNWVDTSEPPNKDLMLSDGYHMVESYDELGYDTEEETDFGLIKLKINLEELPDALFQHDLECGFQDLRIHQKNGKRFGDFVAEINVDIDDKENFLDKNKSQTSLNSAFKTRDQNSLRSLRNANASESKDDQDSSSTVGTGKLILNQLPDFKKKPYINLEDSLCIRPEVLNKTDGEITYYKDLNMIPDKTWLPRKFQLHRVKCDMLQGCDPVYYYHKNPHCPKSSGSETCNQKQQGFIKNLSTYRYSRKSKFSKKIEVMCRLCRGQNWVLKSKYNHHMAFSHGVLIPFHQKSQQANSSGLSLVLSPTSLYTSKNRKFTNFFVKCLTCEKWIKLGLGENVRQTGKSTNGLYHNYFLHYLKNHSGASI